MMTASLEGFGTGIINRAYPSARNGVPALKGFYFGFGVGRGAGKPIVDNELQYFMLLPGGASKDVTPTADLAPTTIPAGRAELAFSDAHPNSSSDEYFYRASHVMLDGHSARRFQFRDVGDAGSVRRRLPPGILNTGPIAATSSILALAGFKMFFTRNREHEIDEITVMLEDDGDITIAFNDKNDDDVFAYLIDVVRISGIGMNITLGEASGSAKGGQRVALQRPPGTDFVLRGFHFDFASGDHEMRDIGVIPQNDRLEVFFGDRKADEADDRFSWKVRYAHVGPQVVAPV